jgi:putative tryptophan/tyrosine transport system substrate-binding protein
MLGMELSSVSVNDVPEIETAIASHARAPSGGLVFLPDAFMTQHSKELIALAARYKLPAVYANLRLFPDGGGLLSYGSDVLDNFRRAAIYADRILKGEKPGELPVQAPEKFELVINLKTAKSLGLTVPPSLIGRADEVIE